MEGGVEKGLKEIQGRTATSFVHAHLSVRYFAERCHRFLATKKLSFAPPPPIPPMKERHPSAVSYFDTHSRFSVSLSLFCLSSCSEALV